MADHSDPPPDPADDAGVDAANAGAAAEPTGEIPAVGGDDITTAVPVDAPGAGDAPEPPPQPSGAAPADGAGPPPSAPRARSVAARRWITAIAGAVILLAGGSIALAVSSSRGKPTHRGGAPNIPVVTATTLPSGPPCPLTGQPTSASGVPQRPALAIKVDNYPQARPQSGLNQADIVFEEPVESGITRLVAVFQCQSPPLVGPIRSARAVDTQILDQLSKPLFIHAGGISPVLAMLREAAIINDDIFDHGSIVQKVSGRAAPYNTYVSAAAGWGLDKSDTTPPAPLFTYATATPPGTPVTALHIPFSGTNDDHWQWSAPHQSWLLSFGSSPATVAGGGQISAANVVVQTVHVTHGPWAENSAGALEVQSQMTGSGPVMVLRSGEAITGTWHRGSLEQTTTLTASDGSPIALAPGNTWVEIVPSTVKVTTAATPSTSTTRPS